MVGLATLWLPAVALPALRAPLVVLDLVLLAAVLVDLRRTPRPAAFDVRRATPARVGLSERFARAVTVAGEGLTGLVVEVDEAFDPSFEVVSRTWDGKRGSPPVPGDPSGGPDRGVVLPGGRLRLVREYRSHRRGVRRLSQLRVRVRGPLGLVWRQARLVGDDEVAIEPPLTGIRRALALAASERWYELGVRRLRRRGGLTEFESLRDYTPGDDLRLVDWKAFARLGRPIVREFTEERGQELVLLIDAGRRMGLRAEAVDARGWTKLDHALDAALVLAAVALECGERVGALLFDARPRAFVPPRKGRRQLARLVDALFDAQPAPLESDLARALREVGARHRRRALLCVLSDVPDPLSLDEQRSALRSGSRRHRLVLATLDDPDLRAAAEGRLAVPAGVRAAALDLERERRESLARLRLPGVRVLDALPADAAGPMISAWLDRRRAGA